MKKMFLVVILIVIIIIGVVLLMFYKSTVAPSKVFVSELNVSDSKITLKGTFTDSAIKYSGYKATYNNSKLYIKVKAGLFTFSKSKDVNISITNSYGKIDEIYLQDATSKENRLIYPKK